MVMTQATTAVANTVPVGSAIAIGMTYGMLGSVAAPRKGSLSADSRPPRHWLDPTEP
jgi:hypothetical protein